MDLTARIERVERELEFTERRLMELENSAFFRLLHWPRRLHTVWKGRLGQALLHSRLHPLYLKLAGPRGKDDPYQAWVEHEQATEPPREWYGERIARMRRRKISVVMPAHNPAAAWLEEAIASLEKQLYPDWELCVCDDASGDPAVWAYLARKAAVDTRIRVVRSETNVGIAAATNMAAKLATGEYAAFLDQDDLLAPQALYHVAAAVEDGWPGVVYSDEDRLDERGRRVEPIFKPAWSPDLLLSCMYMGHLLVAKLEAMKRIGWLREGFDGAQDYDLVLRLTDNGAVVRHIPRVLYHWRKHAGSTSASAAAKAYTHEAGARALGEAVARRRLPAEVGDGRFPNTYRLRWHAIGEPRVSLVICSRTGPLLRRCLRDVERGTAYPNREVVVVHHLTGADDALPQVVARAAGVRVCYTGPFDFPVMCNLGARHATGDVLVFLNDDVAPLSPDWLMALVAQAQRPEVGVAGAMLLYPYGAIQHGGLVVGIMNGVGHVHRHTFGGGYWNWSRLARNVSAVTGACLAIRREVFGVVGGFDPVFPVNYNDADLCLRVRRAGYETVFEPAALLRHAECQTRRPGVRHVERTLWANRWSESHGRGDPFYNPNLADDAENASLSFRLGTRVREWR